MSNKHLIQFGMKFSVLISKCFVVNPLTDLTQEATERGIKRELIITDLPIDFSTTCSIVSKS